MLAAILLEVTLASSATDERFAVVGPPWLPLPARADAVEVVRRAGFWTAWAETRPAGNPLAHVPAVEVTVFRCQGEGERLEEVTRRVSRHGFLLGVDADGGVALLERPRRLHLFPIDGAPSSRFALESVDSTVDWLRVDPDVAVVDIGSDLAATRALIRTPGDADDVVTLERGRRRGTGRTVARRGRTLAWVASDGRGVMIADTRGQVTRIDVAEVSDLEIDHLGDEWVFAHGRLAVDGFAAAVVIDVASGATHRLPVQGEVAAFFPEGIFVDRRLWDPVSGANLTIGAPSRSGRIERFIAADSAPEFQFFTRFGSKAELGIRPILAAAPPPDAFASRDDVDLTPYFQGTEPGATADELRLLLYRMHAPFTRREVALLADVAQRNDDPTLRALAVALLADSTAPAAREALHETLRHAGRDQALPIALALASVGHRDDAVRITLEIAPADAARDPSRAARLAMALAQLGDPAVLPYVRALPGGEPAAVLIESRDAVLDAMRSERGR